MKKLIIVFTLVIGSSIVFGQQDPMYTQYMNNEMVINPAYVGSDDVLNATALYRGQWVGGLLDRTPTTFALNAHSPIANSDMGIGGSVVTDKLGVTNRLMFNVAGSYAIALSKGTGIQFGLQLGGTQTRINYTELRIRQSGDDDFAKDVSKFSPNVGAGAYYFTPKFYFGVSLPMMMNNSVASADATDDVIFQEVRHLFVTTGYVYALNESIKIKPTAMIKYVHGAPIELDITGSVIFDDHYWAGLAVRSGESLSFLGAIQASSQLKVGYSYDLILNGLAPYQKGSHEMMVNYRFAFSKGKILSPRMF
jgi:type IX secretion system PorP/SprF family membrane protein